MTSQDHESSRLICCVCGADTEDAFDYVKLEATIEEDERQFQHFGVHAACFHSVTKPGIEILIGGWPEGDPRAD